MAHPSTSSPRGSLGPRSALVVLATGLAAFFVSDTAVQAAPCDYWVAPTGSNSNPGTQAAPWATLSYAVTAVPDTGRTVCAKDGTYSGRMTINRRFSTMATFRAENSYKARLQANDTVVYSFGGRNITVEGFEIKHSGSSTAYVVQIQMNDDIAGDFSRRAENIVLRNNVLHDSLNNDIVKVNNGAHFITIEGNVFYNQEGLHQHIDANSVQDVTIQDNIFFNDFAGSGRVNRNDTAAFIVVKDSGGDKDGYSGAQRVTIRRNVFLNWEGIDDNNFILNGDGDSPPDNPYYESMDVMMENNLMIGSSAHDMRTPVGVKGCKNITFRNNTVVGDLPSCAYAMRLNVEPGGFVNENIAFYNNIWSDPTGTMGAGCGGGNDFSDGAASETNGEVLDRNLYWNGGAAIPAGDVFSPLIHDANRLVANPLLNTNQASVVLPRWNGTSFLSGHTTIRGEFVRLVNTYGALPATSPAVGAANAARAPVDDILGNPRSTPELGAFELAGAQPSATLAISDASLNEGQTGTTTATFTVTLSSSGTSIMGAALPERAPSNGPDLAVALSGTSEAVSVGHDVGYTATVRNTGTAAAPAATLILELPAELTLVSAAPECSARLETLTCPLSALGPGEAVRFDVRGFPSVLGEHRVQARLMRADREANIANNGATLRTRAVVEESAFVEAAAEAVMGTVTVSYSTANGTATAGSDYTATSGTLTFPEGVTTQTVHVAVAGDAAVEPNETFFVNLSNPSGATISDGQGVGTILNDDASATPQLSINDVAVTEGHSGTQTATFTVSLSAASSNPVTVSYATANGSATAGSDYVAASGTLTFPAGTTSRAVAVTVNGDTAVEPNETFLVNLSNPSGATLADGQGVGTIGNDDSGPVLPRLSINDVSRSEGNGRAEITFTVTLDAASSSTVSVPYATADGTARAGVDYVAEASTITFSPGVLSRNIYIRLRGDRIAEPTETFFVNLGTPTNATLLDGQGVGTIVDNDQ